MLWEVEIRPLGRDAERERVCDEFDLLTHGKRGVDLVKASARGFLFEGNVGRPEAEKLVNDLIVDPLVEFATLTQFGEGTRNPKSEMLTVLLKPGVMDPVSESVLDAARDFGTPLAAVRTFRRYFSQSEIAAADRDILFRKV